MAKRIFITATNTDIGKTYTTVRLMHAFTEMGLSVGALKPIETGVDTIPPDGTLLLDTLRRLNPKSAHMSVSDVVPVQMKLPAAPFVAAYGSSIDWQVIRNALTRMESICDVCLIEGAGGLLVPVDAERDMIDLIGYFDATALLVAHCRLGCINDLRLSLEALRQRDIPHAWALNCRREEHADFSQTSKPYFDAAFPECHLLENDLERLCKTLLL